MPIRFNKFLMTKSQIFNISFSQFENQKPDNTPYKTNLQYFI
jgi:hypothetical protein